MRACAQGVDVFDDYVEVEETNEETTLVDGRRGSSGTTWRRSSIENSVSPEATRNSLRLGPAAHATLGSDGLWDGVPYQEAVDIVLAWRKEHAEGELTVRANNPLLRQTLPSLADTDKPEPSAD